MPITVTCEFCGQTLELAPDSEEQRQAQTDPYQQLRVHVMGCANPYQLQQHARRHGWLLDLLAFRAADAPKWNAQIHALIDAYLERRI